MVIILLLSSGLATVVNTRMVRDCPADYFGKPAFELINIEESKKNIRFTPNIKTNSKRNNDETILLLESKRFDDFEVYNSKGYAPLFKIKKKEIYNYDYKDAYWKRISSHFVTDNNNFTINMTAFLLHPTRQDKLALTMN